ncbi:aromatic-ring-hydroxylating dioxygenase subunit beta [Curvibacter sp. HBC28]|uniref:Aromatic-ring-hydroxylating dioxygenase subunit beta n=1 Tax=Curvibacter microcysteis TaxID=3026419 RepID=A0ABT5MAS2_9BURK|nr:aromatic-ring-hydroxylating dioxygenase subunit beta [Curvibacter sp. HBC28]MDD0813684.1 aromatic-ring-hydroxylating dioxygenase subunit beta [Curvibacter sp. HBC28]
MKLDLLNAATAFVWTEADLLDHADYEAWLSLWAADGLYIIPIDPATNDFANTLNYAYDDAEMRVKRVKRLTSGESISTSPAARTVRSVSRLRVLAQDGDRLTLRGAQELSEFRKDTLRRHVADVTWVLQARGDSFVIHSKVVRLINSSDALTSIGYIL